MTALAKYDAARRALAEAVSVDEVKDIRDKAIAMQAYAAQAKDTELIGYATEIRLRAERRAGEMLIDMADSGERPLGRKKESHVATLSDLGITNTQSHRWQKLAELEADDFEQQVAASKQKAAASTDSVQSTALKQRIREAREQTLAAKQLALPDKRYGVIVCDPPWRFEPWSRSTGMDRAADNHYPTEAFEVIARTHDVPSIAADDCVLFLWATAPMLADAILLMTYCWAFTYKTHCIWDKLIAGTGYWFRNRHELLLIGTKGKIPAPAMGEQEHSIISAQRSEHSAKPEKFLRLIEIYFPTLPKIELNCRGPPRPGWEAWGNEAEHAATPTACEPASDNPPTRLSQDAGSTSSEDEVLDIPQFLVRKPQGANP